MKDVKEQKQNDNGEIIEMKQGQVIKIPKNGGKAWLTLFYSLPQEFVSKRPVYLNLPRCPYEVLRTDKYDSLIKDDTFLELVWDCVAWSAWQYFEIPYQNGSGYREIPGSPAQYSGDFPLWRLSYSMLPLLRDKFEVSGFSFQQLYNVPEGTELPWLTYQQFGNLIGTLVPEIIQEQNWQPMIDEIWNCRQVNDYSGKNCNKKDFMRSWNHSRTAQHISIEDLMENGTTIDGEQLYEIADPRGEFESKVISEIHIEEFKGKLTEQDAKILQMRYDGYSLQEIADAVGFKTAGAVSKHIAKIAGSYEDFVSDEYSKFLDEHTKISDTTNDVM